jgi:hypothetical protein
MSGHYKVFRYIFCCNIALCGYTFLPMSNAGMDAVQVQITLLKHQIELEESNLKYAVELRKDYDLLKRLRLNIITLKELLSELTKKQENKDLVE